MRVTTVFIVLLLMVGISPAQTQDDHLRLGKLHASQGRWREAEEQFRLFLNDHSPSAKEAAAGIEEAVILHAQSLMALGQPFDATLRLEDYLKHDSDSVAVLKLYGYLLDAVIKDRAKAEETLIRCSKFAPRDVEIWRSLGNLYLVSNRYDDSIRCFKEAVRLRPASPLLISSLAYSEGKASPSPRVGAAFVKAIRLNGRAGRPDAAVHLLYGDYLLQTNNALASVAQLTAALLIDPHLSEAYFLRALANERLKKYPQAEADALAAIREDEKRKDAHQLLLRLYRARNDQEKAEREAAILQRLGEENSQEQAVGRDVRKLLATAEPLLRAGKYTEAAQAYEEIVKAAPEFYEAYFALGISYFQLGKFSASESSLKKYLSFQPISGDGRAALGVLLMQQGRFVDAMAEFKKAVEIDPGATEARKGLAHCALLTGKAEAVESALDSLYQQGNSCDPECYVLLAKAQFAMNRTERAVEILNRGLKLYERSIDYLKSLTQLLLDERPRGVQTRQYVTILREMEPAEAEIYYFSSLLEYLDSNPDRAINEAKKGLELAADGATRARLHGVIGRAEEKLDNDDKAEAAFKTAREISRKLRSPDFQIATFYARFLVHRSREEEALTLLSQIIEESPHAGAAYLERAKILAARRNSEQAIADAKQALAHAGLDLETTRAAHALLVRAYYSIGKKSEAQFHQRQWQTLR